MDEDLSCEDKYFIFLILIFVLNIMTFFLFNLFKKNLNKNARCTQKYFKNNNYTITVPR